MKKYILSFIILVLFAFEVVAQTPPPDCCPEFSLLFKKENRECCLDCKVEGEVTACMCKYSTNTFLVVPNLLSSGYTYSWDITGGTPSPAAGNPVTGNPVIITWGGGMTGTITVTISSADGSCVKTIKETVCLRDAPIPSFTVTRDNECAGTPITFTNTSIGGATVSWNFGDGSFAGDENSSIHTYDLAGTYIVTMTVCNTIQQDVKDDQFANGSTSNLKCGCCTSFSDTITVNPGNPLTIVPNDCNSCLCPGDIAEYCASTPCNSYNWTVSPGHSIISGQGTQCVKVQWGNSYPTTLTLNAPGCGNNCGDIATLHVPVLVNNIPILPNNSPICQNTNHTYYLPPMPGVLYAWNVTGGYIAGPSLNTSSIDVHWLNGTTGTVSCSYKNMLHPETCNGTSSLTIALRPVLQIVGTPQICEGNSAYFSEMQGNSATWSAVPAAGVVFSPVTGPNTTVSFPSTGTYTIFATGASGAFCNSPVSTAIIVRPKPVLTLTGATTICPNQLNDYSVSSSLSGGSFNWNFITGSGSISPYGTNNSSASVGFTGNGPWTLEVQQTVDGCTANTTLLINEVQAPPPITLTANTICSGGSVTATVAGVVPVGGYTWSCTPGAVITSPQGSTSATFTINSSATITVTSCGGSQSVQVNTTTATVSIIQGPGTCSATLTAQPPGGTYDWFLDGNPIGSGPITATQNGLYLVKANYNGCIAINQLSITNITPLIASISKTGNLCNNGIVTLQVPIPANCPGATFTWSNSAVGNPITVNTSGTYSVSVNCSNGCSATSQIYVPPCTSGPGSCIHDLTITGDDNCSNPVSLTASIPSGCTPTSIFWDYGDNHAGTTGNHHYANPGAYDVYVVMNCSDNTVHCGNKQITVPMVDSLTWVISCGTNSWNIQLQDASLYLPAYSGYTRTWSTSPCGVLSSTSIANPTLTVPYGCNPTVTLTISKNGCTLTKSHTFNFPTTPLTINGPSTVCVGEIFSLDVGNTNFLSYSWNFGDLTTGVTNPISHAFDGTVLNPVVSVSVTDQYGCMFTTTKTITVKNPPPLTITQGPVKICPDCPPTNSLSITSPGFNTFQWYQNGNPISGATGSTYQLCTFNASGNYHATATHIITGCPVTSDTVQVVYLQKPIADIQGTSVQCNSSFYLNNRPDPFSHPNWTYSWSVSPAATISSPDSYQTNITATASPTPYLVILEVTDTVSHCTARDTLCVFVFANPTVSIQSTGDLCEGNLNILTAVPNIPGNTYLWNNGVIGSTMTTGQAGTYSVTAVNLTSGCSANSNSITVKKRPNVVLFPACCDTICDTLCNTMILDPILPALSSPPSGYSNYTIAWYDNGILLPATGPFLPLSNLTSPLVGNHNISIHVNFINNPSCISISDTFHLVVKPCGIISDTLCCPQLDQIKIRNSNQSLAQQSYQGNDYTLFTTQVSIAGGNTPYTEIRATVVDFELSANFNDCIDCTNYPFTWASLSATSLAGITPTTTGVVPATGYVVPSNIYGNPREVVWDNNAPINLSAAQTTSLSFYLPSESSIGCCMLKAKICVKYSLYDINCNLCEIDTCYEVFIGDTTSTPGTSCCCEKWEKNSLTVTGESRPNIKIRPIQVDCGGSVNLSPGKYTISAPAFICSPATCNVSYAWSVTKNPLTTDTSNSPGSSGSGNSLNYNFNSPGQYVVAFTPQCGSCKCEPCKIIVNIESGGNDCKCKGLITHDVSVNWKDPGLRNGTANCPDKVNFTIGTICKNTPVTGNFYQYICDPEDCQVKYTWKVMLNGSTQVAGEVNSLTTDYSFTPTIPGKYELFITPICGNNRCEKVCTILFKIENIKICKVNPGSVVTPKLN